MPHEVVTPVISIRTCVLCLDEIVVPGSFAQSQFSDLVDTGLAVWFNRNAGCETVGRFTRFLFSECLIGTLTVKVSCAYFSMHSYI